MWGVFLGWLVAAVLCGAADLKRHLSLFLPIFFVSSAIITVGATRGHRPGNYRFDFVRSGVVRSPLGFEVRASNSLLEYVEGDHVISWRPRTLDATVGQYNLSEQSIAGWDAPFANEPIDADKKREITRAVRSALVYLQLVDAGKIRPKGIRSS